MFENKGVKVFKIEKNNTFDGLLAWVNDLPVIVLNKNVDTVRKCFTALLGFSHLSLMFDLESTEKLTEKLCHRFAGAVLFPKNNLIAQLGQNRKRISLQELIALKEYYGISIQAIMVRALALNLISGQRYKEFRIFIAKKIYKKRTRGV